MATLKRICELLPTSSDTLLFGKPGDIGVDELAAVLKRLPPEKFIILRDLIYKIIETYSMLEQD